MLRGVKKFPRSPLNHLGCPGRSFSTAENTVEDLSDTVVLNPFNIQLLPHSIRDKLFSSSGEHIHHDNEKIETQRNILANHDLLSGNAKTEHVIQYPELPPLFGDIETHFYSTSEELVKPYVNLINQFIYMHKRKPLPMPEKWCFQSGWTVYDPKTGEGRVCPNGPEEEIICFDTENIVGEGQHPTLAVALSTKAYYSWLSPHITEGTCADTSNYTLRDFIPFKGWEGEENNKKCRLVVGHNVSFDRSKMASEYMMSAVETHFLDTMSMHIAVAGMTSGQRILKKMFEKEEGGDENAGGDGFAHTPSWIKSTSFNNLSSVYKLYCGENLEKEKRDIFVEGKRSDVVETFQSLVKYCADDTLATLNVMCELYPKFRASCPHPATLFGMLEMNKAYLPMRRSRWNSYLYQAEAVAKESRDDRCQVLSNLAREAVQLGVNESYKDDMWMWSEDWKVKPLKMKKETPKKKKTEEVDNADGNQQPFTELDSLREKFSRQLSRVDDLYKVQPKVAGYPTWFQSTLEHSEDGILQSNITTSKQISPKLLRMTWFGHPLHYDKVHKWGFVSLKNGTKDVDPHNVSTPAPAGDAAFPSRILHERLSSRSRQNLNFSCGKKDVVNPLQFRDFPSDQVPKRSVLDSTGAIGDILHCERDLGDDCLFTLLPHRDGSGLRVGNPLTKGFEDKLISGVLAVDNEDDTRTGHHVLESTLSTTYWTSNQDRIKNQTVVNVESTSEDSAVVIPHVVSAGTMTRRAVEKTWLTASNAKPHRIGSELKCLVEAPPGYAIVGADVDSQEMWIAAALGDSRRGDLKEHGSTPSGWMCLQGCKSDGTDLHSVTAKLMEISRDEAKVINYGRIYGAGATFAGRLLSQYQPLLTKEEASEKAKEMFRRTKGDRVYTLSRLGELCLQIYASVVKDESKMEIQPLQIANSDDNENESENDVIVVSKNDIYRLVAIYREMCSIFPKLKRHSKEMLDDTDLKDEIRKTSMSKIKRYQLFRHYKKNFENDNDQLKEKRWNDTLNNIQALTSKMNWIDGLESEMFNALESIARRWSAKTPVLQCNLSSPLSISVKSNPSAFLPSRINWVVQSSAVDYLHLLLVSMRHLCSKYRIDCRFCLSIHDEVRYVAAEHDVYRVALALQISNLFVRAMFCSRLGFSNVPSSCAFFSGVDIDRVMRKEPRDDCVTPSQPHGLKAAHGIPLGVSLSIDDIVQRVKSL